MKFLISQPSTLYYAWQTEILLNNMISVGINLNDVEVVCSGQRTSDWNKLANGYAARFFFYPNTSKSNYPSIARPNALKHHYRQYPTLSAEAVLYTDCDILFFKSPHSFLQGYLNDDINYLSDCKWYIGYSYFKNKEKQGKAGFSLDETLKILCERISLDFDLLVQNDDNSGGAQYLLKGIDANFWEEVEKDCDTIYNYFNYNSQGSINGTYFNSENEGIQSFCSDMWAVLWNLWKRGKETRIVKELEFAWPGYGIQDKDRFNIFHNAGVVNDREQLFYKAKYLDRLPYQDDFSHIKRDRLSWLYTEKIIELKDKTCLV